MKFHISLILVAVTLVSCSGRDIIVDNDIPAGNITFERMSGDTVYVHQELRDTRTDWFYWAFRVKGAQGRKLTFVFTESGAVCDRGPVVSLDKGKTYEFLAEEGATSHSFSYAFSKNAREVWFYECFPYTPQMWQSFVEAPHAGEFEAGVLCKSRGGLDVPFLKVSPKDETPVLSVVVTSRHHCSEAPATYVLEGFTSAFLEDSELGSWLRANIGLIVVPFVDMDGVVAGDQGKNRAPHDHNRDYTEFIYPETAELARLMTELQPDVFLDFHNPTHTGKYIYSPLSPTTGSIDGDFGRLVEKYQEGGLNYRSSDDLPFGVSWNTSKNYSEGLSSRNWVTTSIKNIKIARTFEIPFTYANGAEVYPDKMRLFGHGIARALRAVVEDSQTDR